MNIEVGENIENAQKFVFVKINKSIALKQKKHTEPKRSCA